MRFLAILLALSLCGCAWKGSRKEHLQALRSLTPIATPLSRQRDISTPEADALRNLSPLPPPPEHEEILERLESAFSEAQNHADNQAHEQAK